MTAVLESIDVQLIYSIIQFITNIAQLKIVRRGCHKVIRVLIHKIWIQPNGLNWGPSELYIYIMQNLSISVKSYITFYLFTVAPTVTVEFEAGNVTVNEGDGSVTVNLLRTGNHSESISAYISIMRIANSAIFTRMCMHHVLLSVLYSVSQ